jgi:hypothetical protein
LTGLKRRQKLTPNDSGAAVWEGVVAADRMWPHHLAGNRLEISNRAADQPAVTRRLTEAALKWRKSLP